MKLFKIQASDWGYDQYDSVIIVAKSSDDAVAIFQNRLDTPYGPYWGSLDDYVVTAGTWPENISKSTVTKIGAASDKLARGTIVIASFNAG